MDRIVVTLGKDATNSTRQLAEKQQISYAEVVRRGLSLYALYSSLEAGETLAVYDRQTKSVDRVHMMW
jgi:hypothetical protein